MRALNLKFIIIVGLIILLAFVFYMKVNFSVKMSTENIEIDNESKTVYLDSLTLKQKIAQMFIVRSSERNLPLTNVNIGGIFIDGLKTEEEYRERSVDACGIAENR